MQGRQELQGRYDPAPIGKARPRLKKGSYGWVVPAECRVGKESATDPRRGGTVFELG